MKFFHADLDSLRKLYGDQLDHLYSMEAQILEAFPQLVYRASDTELKHALENHFQQTKGHVARLEQIMHEARGKVESKKSKGMAALISEGEDLITDISDESVRDAAIIASAQKIEHYEIAAYGTARNFAQILRHEDQAELLRQSLEEEKQADATLTTIADRANSRADKAA